MIKSVAKPAHLLENIGGNYAFINVLDDMWFINLSAKMCIQTNQVIKKLIFNIQLNNLCS